MRGICVYVNESRSARAANVQTLFQQVAALVQDMGDGTTGLLGYTVPSKTGPVPEPVYILAVIDERTNATISQRIQDGTYSVPNQHLSVFAPNAYTDAQKRTQLLGLAGDQGVDTAVVYGIGNSLPAGVKTVVPASPIPATDFTSLVQ